MKLSVGEALVAAKELIKTPDKWCQGFYAYNSLGTQVYPMDDAACRFCTVGAMGRVLGCTKPTMEYLEPLYVGLNGPSGLAEFNDLRTTSHADIMSLFDRAIESCHEENE